MAPKIRLQKRGIKKPTKPRVAKAKPKPMKKTSTLASIEQKLQSPAVQKMLKQAQKKFGNRVQGYVRPMPPLVVIPTGITEIDDIILGCGGIPGGQVGEIFGPESGGKTTTALAIIAAYQRIEKTTAFIDMEHSMDGLYARANGVDVDQWLYFKPLYGEECVEMILMCLEAGIDLVVVDSWGALFSKDLLDKEVGQHERMAARARLVGVCLKKSLPPRHKYGNSLIAINQIRDNIGAMPFEAKHRTPGGWDARHAYFWRIEVKKGTKIRNKKTGLPTSIKAKLFGAKNKGGPPFRRAEIEIRFGTGLSIEGSVLDDAIRKGIVKKSGGWLSWGEERIGNGRDKVIKIFEEDQDLFERFKTAVGALAVDAEPVNDDEDDTVDEGLEGLGDFTLDEGELDLDE